MLFTSFEFLFYFLPLVFICFYLFKKFSIYTLIFASLIFYSLWNYYYLIILIFSILFNFYLGVLILKYKNKLFLIIGIFINLLILVSFKYTDFLIENYNLFFNKEILIYNLIFPLALSFYTLQQIAFLIDCHEREIKKVNFKIYFTFVTFFPQLISGPIVLYNDVYSYYSSKNLSKINFKNLFFGVVFIIFGLSKKIILADTLSSDVNLIYSSAEYVNFDFITTLFVSVLFTYQIYFDFSGYTDMAIGLALLFNIKLPFNFNSPYKSFSIIEFWTKWHMTLSNFINNYFFFIVIRKFNISNFFIKNFLILFIMILVGFWHGPTWGYVIFGFIHGVAVLINYFWKQFVNINLNKYFSWFLTFTIVNFAFIFFKSPNLNIASNMMIGLSNIFEMTNTNNLNSIQSNFSKTTILCFIIATIIIFFTKNTQSIVEKFKPNIFYIFILAFLFSTCLLRLRGLEFIYFAF